MVICGMKRLCDEGNVGVIVDVSLWGAGFGFCGLPAPGTIVSAEGNWRKLGR
jgi:hypothetical protein